MKMVWRSLRFVRPAREVCDVSLRKMFTHRAHEMVINLVNETVSCCQGYYLLFRRPHFHELLSIFTDATWSNTKTFPYWLWIDVNNCLLKSNFNIISKWSRNSHRKSTNSCKYTSYRSCFVRSLPPPSTITNFDHELSIRFIRVYQCGSYCVRNTQFPFNTSAFTYSYAWVSCYNWSGGVDSKKKQFELIQQWSHNAINLTYIKSIS